MRLLNIEPLAQVSCIREQSTGVMIDRSQLSKAMTSCRTQVEPVQKHPEKYSLRKRGENAHSSVQTVRQT